MDHRANKTPKREHTDKKPGPDSPGRGDSSPRFPERHESNESYRGRRPVPIPDWQGEDRAD